MTLITTDSQHYADIASAIRSKAGVQTTYLPSEMANAIAAIPTGGGSDLGTKTITVNGTYNASSDNLDGYSQVTINVPTSGATIDQNHMYYNGYLLPTLPVVSGYDYVWIRKNDQTGNYDAIYGTSVWYPDPSASLNNWSLTFVGIGSGYKHYTTSQSNPTSWTEVQSAYNSFGTDNNRDVIWSSHDILDAPNGDVLYKHGIPVSHYV